MTGDEWINGEEEVLPRKETGCSRALNPDPVSHQERVIQYCFKFLVLDPHLKSNRLPPGSPFEFFHPFLPTPPSALLPKTCQSNMHDDVYYKPENLAQRWVIIWPFSQRNSTTTQQELQEDLRP